MKNEPLLPIVPAMANPYHHEGHEEHEDERKGKSFRIKMLTSASLNATGLYVLSNGPTVVFRGDGLSEIRPPGRRFGVAGGQTAAFWRDFCENFTIFAPF
jgi:hypothetical protein